MGKSNRKNPKAKWVLPTTVNPTGRKCIQIQVPDDPAHIAAFRGALLALQSAYNWQDDPAHTAKEVALVWREIIDNSQDWGCDGMQTLIAFDDLCGLQWSYDGGLTWNTANFENCGRYAAQQEIQQAINDGTISQPGGQPGPTTPPGSGECKSYHVQLSARDKWLLPSVVNAGDTIAISNAVGGWNDGALRWYCPTGKIFLLGACTNDEPYQTSDPMQSGNHMQLIGGYGMSAPVYFNPLSSGFYVVPAGVVNEQLWLQANDANLADNQGDIQFDVQVCTSNSWCHLIDFAVSSGDFYANPTGRATYIAGTGWAQGAGGYTQIRRDFGFTSTVYEISIWTVQNPSADREAIDVYVSGGGFINSKQDAYTMDGGLYKRVHILNDLSMTSLWITADYAGGGCTIKKVMIKGIGENHFGGSNC